ARSTSSSCPVRSQTSTGTQTSRFTAATCGVSRVLPERSYSTSAARGLRTETSAVAAPRTAWTTFGQSWTPSVASGRHYSDRWTAARSHYSSQPHTRTACRRSSWLKPWRDGLGLLIMWTVFRPRSYRRDWLSTARNGAQVERCSDSRAMLLTRRPPRTHLQYSNAASAPRARLFVTLR